MRELFECYVFWSFFQPNSNVDISETVHSIDLKFEVRIVLDHVPFQIEFQVIRTNVLEILALEVCRKKDRKNVFIRGRELFEDANYSRASTISR